MVVRSAQKGRDDIQRIRDAMESRKPVITDYQRELIVKQANIIGEDGVAMVQDIEDAALETGQLAADVFKMIESCLASLNQKVGRQMHSDEVTRQKEPERLKQIEAIREQATMLFGSRLNGDKPSEESVVKTMRELVNEYMAAVDQDKEDGLDPDTARLWKEQVQGIVAHANLDQPAAGAGGSGPDTAPQVEAMDCLAPLKYAIDQARYTTFAVTRELTDPEETVLRGFGKQLGSSKKEIMALSKDLAVGQPVDVAMEATRLAGEVCDAIKISRESIRAALRELGAASDISEVSGPTRTRPQQQERPAMGRLDPAGRQPAVSSWPQHPPPPPEWAAGAQPAASAWYQRPPPPRATAGNAETRWPPSDAHAGRFSVAPCGVPAQTQDERGGRGVVNPHEGHDERPGEQRRVAHF
jgi:hypothetical protein